MEAAQKYTVYRLRCVTSGKDYVGQTKYTPEKRFKKHVQKALSNTDKQQCRALNNAIRLYGVESFTIETVDGNCTKENIDEKEIEYIAKFNTLAPNGYNLTRGSSFRVENWSDESKNKLSDAVRKNCDYDLPRNVVEIKNHIRGEYGFRVITPNRTYTFISSSQTMEEKYQASMNCYQITKDGGLFEMENKHKRHKDEDLIVPKYVVRRGNMGFAVNKKGFKRKTFNQKGNTREQNLQNAIEYLKTIE